MYPIGEKAFSWIPPDEIEAQAIEQVRLVASMPFIHEHVAVMPDCHLGIGATVGSVIPTDDAIIPAAVGVDIGCGVMAVETGLRHSDLAIDLLPLRENIERRIPLSLGGRNERPNYKSSVALAVLQELAGDRSGFYDDKAPNWREQLGSLGSGNHFIEIVQDDSEKVWAFLHSGSRGVGNKLAGYHIQQAKQWCHDRSRSLPHKDLAYLEEGTPQFDAYIADLRWCQAYAKENRAEMMDRVLSAIADVVYGDHTHPLERLRTVQCHHNYTEKELHFGKKVWVSRKGAILAAPGVEGLIPGSMGTRSYVVEGKGNAMSFNSAPHGAGRRFSRGEARRRFTMEDFDRSMQGIEVKRDSAFLDEIPGAYKDVDAVMEQSSELVAVTRTFKQVVNVKGSSARGRKNRRHA